jgi:hypothetical protein
MRDQPGKSATSRQSAGRTKAALFLQLVLFIMAALMPSLAICAYAFSASLESRLRIFGMSAVFGSAAVAIGGLIGFLFGIPRSRTTIESTESGARTIGAEPTVTPNTSLPNTNLEQISDWLTKVLIGITLAQIGKVGSGAADLFNKMSNGLGVGRSGTAFVGALVTYSTAIGFTFGWLATRMWVAWAIAAVDVSASESTNSLWSREPCRPGT